MSKVAVVYWSGTGNTAAMADAVMEGIKDAGAEGTILTSGEFDASMISSFDGFAFGCPAMGAEVLEEGEFDPMFEACKPQLAGKKTALFGSYGWGDGEWMRLWEQDCDEAGIRRVCDSVMCCGAPDENAVHDCRSLGAALVR